MSAISQPGLTPQEYLAIERAADIKSEYFAGEMFAMSGATFAHNLISINLLAGIHRQLVDRPCHVFGSDMRLSVQASGLYTYPDVVALCGQPQFDDKLKDNLLNPNLVIEVLSKSTQGYDRGVKFEHYRKIQTLKEYILVSQDKIHVERFSRQEDNTWNLWETEEPDALLVLASIDCTLMVSEIYSKVEFGEGE